MGWIGGFVDWWSGSFKLGVRRLCKSLLARATAMGRRIIIHIIIIIVIIIQPLRAFRRADLGEGIWKLVGSTLASLGA